jgi:uroporphyrin-III C-methyltransferase
MNETSDIGKVILAGAGPGDPELITLKLQRRLAEADVIIADRLVNPGIISSHARADVRVLLAGKQGYHEKSFSQEAVTALIIEYALAGKKVLRLKGGDVAFFSNVLDELQALVENKIPFEIIPGITAASGASAYAGIPLTARGYAQAVHFLTYNPESNFPDDTWKQLALTRDTLVFYMASRNLSGLVEMLLRFSCYPLTPLAIIEQASTIHQAVYISTLRDSVIDFAGKTFLSPSLVIIGDVVSLHEKFKWHQGGKKGTEFPALK